MSWEQLFEFVHQGGAYCAPLLLLALGWLAREYRRVLEENKEKDKYLRELAEQSIAINAEVKGFLTNERRAS
jgi:hypothetical protein